MNDRKCKYRHSCGYDFCMGEGACPDFEKGRPIKEDNENYQSIFGYDER